jgi:hypothetical protein
MNTSVINRLIHQPLSLQQLVSNLPEQAICLQPEPGKWSIFENIAHLGRYQEVFKDRLTTILTETNPSFKRYKAEEDTGFAIWTNKALAQLLEDFTSTRNELNNFLQLLTAEQCNSCGMHPAFGLMTINGWVEFFLLHEAHHLFAIFKIARSQSDKTFAWY